jgi:hypothetical protein
MTSALDPFAFPACLTRFTGPQDAEPALSYVALMALYGVAVPASSTEDAAIGGTKPEHSAAPPASNVIALRSRRPAPGRPL